MSEPKVAATVPSLLELEPGKRYWYCTCGHSASQPFCDGAHAGSGFEPKEFTVDEAKKYAVCQCKHTGKAPFCDGAHKHC